MILGVPKEIKNHEYRVGMIPSGVRETVAQGHQVFLETGAGDNIGIGDDDYRSAGAIILSTAVDVFAKAEMIVKVKEPLPAERAMLRAGQVLFTYLHLAPDQKLTKDLIASKVIALGYETVTDDQGRLPLLAPMSEVAGRMAIQAGALALEKSHGGRGILLAGVPGVEPGKVVILGAGIVGSNAALMAVGLGARVVVLDRNIEALRRLQARLGSAVETVYSNAEAVERHVTSADLVIGSVLIPGGATPKLISRSLVARMKPGAAIVDVAIDQGGCAETSRPTTHSNPIYIDEQVAHYCVANMPGAVARTATFALNNATLPYIIKLANQGYREALRNDRHLRNGLNVFDGKITCKNVAAALALDFVDPVSLLG